MYRVAVVINENEKIHSVYANTVEILKNALKLVYGDDVNQIYSFEEIDKFNVSSLFELGPRNIDTFDSIFIATNACNNKDIYDALVAHKKEISNFIDNGLGKHRGICIANQQKLGSSATDAVSVEFLPEQLSYKLIKRPEKSSSDGNVNLFNKKDLIVQFPLKIDQATIDYHCSGEANNFMPHKYRFFLQPLFPGNYDVIYYDGDNKSKGDDNPQRLLLLKSRLENERIVISSVVLDWAEHLEQLANILVFITEGIDQYAVITKKQDNQIASALFEKGVEYKIPIKLYVESNQKKLFDLLKLAPFKSVIFTNEFKKKNLEDLWSKITDDKTSDKTFYIINSEGGQENNELFFDCLYSRTYQNDRMFLDGQEWIIANFITKKWRKSIWTYHYITDLLSYINYKNISYIQPLYKEIKNHFKYKYENADNGKELDGKEKQSYDNVFNSSCACLKVLYNVSLAANRKEKTKKYVNDLQCDIERFGNWIVDKLINDIERKQLSYQDIISAIVSLAETNYIGALKQSDTKSYKFIADSVVILTNDLFNKLIDANHSKIDNTFTYADIAKIFRLISVLDCFDAVIDKQKTKTVIGIIVNYLQSMQRYDGKWRNLSLTAELTLAILQAFSSKSSYMDYENKALKSITSSAIIFIKESYNYEQKCWLNDENTTAKCVHIISLYDELFNYAIEDLLLDITHVSTNRTNPLNVTNNIIALDEAQNRCNSLLKEKNDALDESKRKSLEIKKNKKLISRYKVIVGFLVASEALLLLLLGWIFGVLGSKYSDTLAMVFSENIAIILSTIIGFVVTTIITGIYVYLKNKAMKDSNEE